jgi:hypothetical protein
MKLSLTELKNREIAELELSKRFEGSVCGCGYNNHDENIDVRIVRVAIMQENANIAGIGKMNILPILSLSRLMRLKNLTTPNAIHIA